MVAPFASIETATASSGVAALSNATMVYSGSDIAVIFDAQYVDVLGISGSGPQADATTASVASISVGSSVTIDSVSYSVIGKEPDGTGMTTLKLQLA